jgi:hypothetical protein
MVGVVARAYVVKPHDTVQTQTSPAGWGLILFSAVSAASHDTISPSRWNRCLYYTSHGVPLLDHWPTAISRSRKRHIAPSHRRAQNAASGKRGTSTETLVQAKMEADRAEHTLLSAGSLGFHGTILAKSGGKVTRVRGGVFSWLLGRPVTLQSLFPACSVCH